LSLEWSELRWSVGHLSLLHEMALVNVVWVELLLVEGIHFLVVVEEYLRSEQ